MNIGFAIRKVRQQKNITQEQLSSLTGISQTSISQIEKGGKRPSFQNQQKICKALGIPEALLYFYGLEKNDVPAHKKQAYDLFYPTIEDMIKKLID